MLVSSKFERRIEVLEQELGRKGLEYGFGFFEMGLLGEEQASTRKQK
jgi:hypothetical protein